MKQLNTFIYSFKRSISDPKYYKDILTVPFSFSLKYLFFLSICVVIIQTLLFVGSVIHFYPQVPTFIKQTKEVLTTAYPQALVVTIKNGEVSTNTKEPYYIDISQLNKFDKGSLKHFITIDTTANPSDYPEYETAVLVTRRAIVYPGKNSNKTDSYSITPIDPEIDVIFSKINYDNIVNQIIPYIDALPTIFIVIICVALFLWPFLGSLFLLLWHMLYLIVGAFFAFIIASIMKVTIPFGKLYQLSMHGITLTVLVNLFLQQFGIAIPFLYTLILCIWMGIVLKEIGNDTQNQQLPQPPIVIS